VPFLYSKVETSEVTPSHSISVKRFSQSIDIGLIKCLSLTLCNKMIIMCPFSWKIVNVYGIFTSYVSAIAWFADLLWRTYRTMETGVVIISSMGFRVSLYQHFYLLYYTKWLIYKKIILQVCFSIDGDIIIIYTGYWRQKSWTQCLYVDKLIVNTINRGWASFGIPTSLWNIG